MFPVRSHHSVIARCRQRKPAWRSTTTKSNRRVRAIITTRDTNSEAIVGHGTNFQGKHYQQHSENRHESDHSSCFGGASRLMKPSSLPVCHGSIHPCHYYNNLELGLSTQKTGSLMPYSRMSLVTSNPYHSSSSSSSLSSSSARTDFRKWKSLSEELLNKSSTWSPADLSLLVECLESWSLQVSFTDDDVKLIDSSPSGVANKANQHTLIKIWKRLESNHKHQISLPMYDYLVQALARWGFPAWAERCFEIYLKHVQRLWQQSPTKRLQRFNIPCRYHMKSISEAYVKLHQPVACENFVRYYYLNHPSLIDEVTIRRVLLAWQEDGNGERAENFLRWVEQQNENIKKSRTMQPNSEGYNIQERGRAATLPMEQPQEPMQLGVDCYSAVCLAWGWTRDRNDAGQRAEKFLREMPMEPDSVCWQGVIRAWAIVPTQPEGLSRAEQVLWYAFQQLQDKISGGCFDEVLKCYGRLGLADRAEDFIERWIQAVSSPQPSSSSSSSSTLSVDHHGPLVFPESSMPNLSSFNSVMLGWAHSHLPNAGEKANAFMRDIIQGKYKMTPDVYTYKYLLQAYAMSGNAEVVTEFLNEMEKTNWNGIDGLTRGDDDNNGNGDHHQNSNQSESDQRLQLYTALIKAWHKRSFNLTQDQRLRCAIHAAAVLDRMVNHGIQPHPYAYNLVLDTFANCKSQVAAQAIEDLLGWMEKRGVPFLELYGINAIKAWANVGNAPRAHALLTRLEQQHKASRCSWYTFTIQAYIVQSKRELEYAEKADSILDRLRSSKDLPDPDFNCYLATLRCWQLSQHVDKANRAWNIIQNMLRDFVTIRKASKGISDPEATIVDAHVLVLLTCSDLPTTASPENRQLALKIALQIFKQIPRRDSRVYYAALKAFGTLMKDDLSKRDEFLRSTFLEIVRREGEKGLHERTLQLMRTFASVEGSSLMDELGSYLFSDSTTSSTTSEASDDLESMKREVILPSFSHDSAQQHFDVVDERVSTLIRTFLSDEKHSLLTGSGGDKNASFEK